MRRFLHRWFGVRPDPPRVAAPSRRRPATVAGSGTADSGNPGWGWGWSGDSGSWGGDSGGGGCDGGGGGGD